MLRNEFCLKQAAILLNDAHTLIIYIDESLLNELGITSPRELAETPLIVDKRLKYRHFTQTSPCYQEAKQQFPTIQKETNVLQILPELYYGFWGSVYNSSLDCQHFEHFMILQHFIDQSIRNYQEL